MSEEISARKDGSNIIVSKGPDVCLTPMGSSMVPVAYNSIAFLDTAVRVSQNVFCNGLQDFNLNSRASVSTGHEPGTGRGVVVPGYKGPAFAKSASSTVATNGFTVVRNNDPAWINRPDLGSTEPFSAPQSEAIKHK